MKLKIIIAGHMVHRVGYRPFLIALADEFDIRRFSVHNSEKDGGQIVIAKADAEDAQLNALIDAIQSRKPKNADVSGIRTEPFEGTVPSIVRTSMLSMSAQLAKGVDAIVSINDKMDLMLNKHDLTNGKLDQILDKQDEAIEEIRDLRDDMVQNSNAERLSRMEKDIRVIKSKIGIKQH
ncbi:MAG: acylphosphatase [Methanothrix sp.]|nr:acylphosphatase [Methanothrix sp.]